MLLLLHAAVTWTMVGVILVVQVVHYPLFRHVGVASYTTFQSEHMHRITWIVAPLMTMELGTAAVLAWVPPPGVPPWGTWSGLGLVVLLWGTTGVVQVPLHRSLENGFNHNIHRRLVRTNWTRTVLWAVRGGLVLWMIASAH